jgi:hypothetical protein
MVPRIMLLVVAMGGVCGIVVSLMLGFIASDITVILESSNYYPVVTLVYETLHSKAGAAIYCFIITLVAYNGTQGSLLVASRQLMALSADGCFPRKWRLHEISPRFQLPIISLVVCCLLNMAAGALYLSGSAGWNALNVACVASFNLSYGMACGGLQQGMSLSLRSDRRAACCVARTCETPSRSCFQDSHFGWQLHRRGRHHLPALLLGSSVGTSEFIWVRCIA